MAMKTGEGIVVKLRHSSSGKMVDLVVTKDSKLDLGSIAATFGLNPLNIKLNGLYISRGPDFISSCLTWNDVLCYFANKDYPTGISNQYPVVVDGSVCRGSCFNFNCSENENSTNPEAVTLGDKRKVLWEDSSSPNMQKKRKTIEGNFGLNTGTNDKHFQDFRGKYNNCYTKRGRDEDPGELHAQEKKRRSQYACDEKKIEWDGGNSPSVQNGAEKVIKKHFSSFPLLKTELSRHKS